MKKTIYKFKGKEFGRKVAVFAGIHGNEKPGIVALKKIIKEIENSSLKIKSGEVYFVFGNPKAIEKNVRQTEKNLNRCFLKNNAGKTYEDSRARELMKILDEVDVLLDIHASTNKKSIPFAITEKNGFELVSKMDFEIVVENFDEYEPGATDGYMKNSGKVGVCLECGYLDGSEKNNDLAYNSILQFLQFYGIIENQIKFTNKKQKVLRIDGVIKYDDPSFVLVKDFEDFETISAGNLIAKSKKRRYFTEKERVLLFATNIKRNIGDEAAILGS